MNFNLLPAEGENTDSRSSFPEILRRLSPRCCGGSLLEIIGCWCLHFLSCHVPTLLLLLSEDLAEGSKPFQTKWPGQAVGENSSLFCLSERGLQS